MSKRRSFTPDVKKTIFEKKESKLNKTKPKPL